MRTSLLLSSLLALPLALAPGLSTADEKVDGKRVFGSKCASCHGADGHGKTKQGEKMKVRAFGEMKAELTDEKIKETILKGINREKDGVKQEMKPLEGKLKPGELEALVEYAKSLK